MHLVIGLGPIGGNIVAHLAKLGLKVYRNDFNADRVREWSQDTKSSAGRSLFITRMAGGLCRADTWVHTAV